MSQALLNTRCLMRACDKLKIPYKIHDENGNFVEVCGSEKMFFINFNTPWNDGSSNKLCSDKEFTYRLLGPHISMPNTVAFFDPNFESQKYSHYKKQDRLEQIISEIRARFEFPLIIKMNSGSKKRNVFLCRTEAKIKSALRSIYNKRSVNYDYIAVAQEYIDIAVEYRVIIFKGRILIIYTKHNEVAEIIGEEKIHAKIADFIAPIFELTNVKFAGLDIAFDQAGKMFLIEMNSCPSFDRLARAHGEDVVVKLYEAMLE